MLREGQQSLSSFNTDAALFNNNKKSLSRPGSVGASRCTSLRACATTLGACTVRSARHQLRVGMTEKETKYPTVNCPGPGFQEPSSKPRVPSPNAPIPDAPSPSRPHLLTPSGFHGVSKQPAPWAAASSKTRGKLPLNKPGRVMCVGVLGELPSDPRHGHHSLAGCAHITAQAAHSTPRRTGSGR